MVIKIPYKIIMVCFSLHFIPSKLESSAHSQTLSRGAKMLKSETVDKTKRRSIPPKPPAKAPAVSTRPKIGSKGKPIGSTAFPYDQILAYKTCFQENQSEFKDIFKKPLEEFWDKLFGFDLVKFDQWIEAGNNSVQKTVLLKFGEQAVALVFKLIRS